MMVKSDIINLELLLSVCFFVKNNFPLIVNKSSWGKTIAYLFITCAEENGKVIS